MEEIALTELLPVYRIALGSARHPDRASFAALFALDTRLGRAVAEASEPIIAQVKLAWWRDRFAEPPADWPIGEPLLARLRTWGPRASELGALVDGWEELVAGDAMTPQSAERFANGRTTSWRTLADHIGVEHQADALERVSRSFAHASLIERGFNDLMPGILGTAGKPPTDRLPRGLRPFAVLGTLGRRAVLKDRPVLDGFPSLALALRTGLTGK